MAKTFYYDSVGLLEATINDGTFSGSSWSDSASMTNEGRLVDQSIATAVSDFNNADALKITFPLSGHAIFVLQSGFFSKLNLAPECKATIIGNNVVFFCFIIF